MRLLTDLTKHLENSPLAVIGWDSEFRVAFWSGQARAMFGYSEDEVLGKHPMEWEFVHQEDRDAVARVIHELLGGDTRNSISRNRNYSRHGDVLYCEWYNSTLVDGESEGVSTLSLVQDVTAQQTLQKQLLQLQKIDAVGQLTGGVAHDFNNLLTVILGHGELLQEALRGKPELLGLAEAMVSAAHRGASLTHQLLAFARQQPLLPQSTDINALIKKLQDLLARTLGEQVEIRLDLSDTSPAATIDAAQLESAILNLCLNARDAMSGGGHLTIETGYAQLDRAYAEANEEVEPGKYVVITISDSGSGIAKEHLDRVFEPFFSTKDHGKGSGLGLSMVFGFVKQSQGHIKIYSEVDEGTTVRLYLPQSQDGTTAHGPEDTKPDVPRGLETVLVVEDDDLVRQYACAQLSALGYEVVESSNGAQALEVLKTRRDIDLLFTDVVMPGGLNGLQLAKDARKLQPDLKVLYTSGYTQNAIVHQGRLDPSVKLLSKPYRRAKLARMIREAIEQ